MASPSHGRPGLSFAIHRSLRRHAFLSRGLKSWSQGECEVVLLLLPARTHQSAFQEAIAGHADVFFLRGRMSFGLPDGGQVEFFGIMLALYGADEAMAAR